jgi:hypothetical protein
MKVKVSGLGLGGWGEGVGVRELTSVPGCRGSSGEARRPVVEAGEKAAEWRR